MGSFWWGQSALDELIEKATSELLPAGQVDLALHLDISDQIRSKKVNAKDAIKSLKQRLSHKNPNVILATLSLIDTCMKNSGSAFVKEVATRDFMEEITHLIKVPTGCNQDVKQKVLYLIQVWGIASKGNPSLSYISGTYSLLRAEGYVFPPVTEKIDSILLETAVAPEWTDSDCCERCRTSFTLTNRKHHCRQCGATFCQQCSSKSIPLPHLGINDTVRVCDGCYIKVKLAKVADKDALPHLLGTPAALNSSSSSLAPNFTPSIKNKNTTTTTTTTTTATTTTEDQFEDDLKKAIEMSLKESEQQKKLSNYYSSSTTVETATTTKAKSKEEEEEEANLAAAIAASLKDMEQSSSFNYSGSNNYNGYKNKSNDLSSTDMENIQLFSTLMQRVKSAGGDISGDAQINKLYTQIGTLQPKLVKTLDETSQKHETFVTLHAKLNKAVKAYDRLLEERLSAAAQRNSYAANNNYGSYQNVPPYDIATNKMTPAQQQQQSYSYPIATPVMNNAAAPICPPPQTPIIQQQQPYPSYPQSYNSYAVQQAPIVQQQPAYVAPTPLISSKSNTSTTTATSANQSYQYPQPQPQNQQPQQQYQQQQYNNSAIQQPPVANPPVAQQQPQQQQYDYPSVPTTAPSVSSAAAINNNYYYGQQQPQQQASYHYNNNNTNTPQQQQQAHNQPAVVEEVPLIEL